METNIIDDNFVHDSNYRRIYIKQSMNTNYEEKYKKALERARAIYQGEYKPEMAATIAEILQSIFSEIKEDENKRIKEAIIATIHLYYGEPLEDEAKEMIAWLEKQGMSYTKRDVDDAYLKGISAAKNEIEKQYEADYQIRKDIATFIFNYRGDIKDRAKWMDYLGIKVSFVEKQDEQEPQGKSALEAINEEKVDNANKVEPKDYNSIDPHFGKPVDKVEPKFDFNVGQWIVATEQCSYLITKIEGFNVTLVDADGNEYIFDTSSLEDAHLWTVQDARCGDILVTDDNKPFIFDGLLDPNHPNCPVAYCGIDGENLFSISLGNYWWTGENVKPATKEQRDLLFQKMKEAGYKWDAVKKNPVKLDKSNGQSNQSNDIWHSADEKPEKNNERVFVEWEVPIEGSEPMEVCKLYELLYYSPDRKGFYFSNFFISKDEILRWAYIKDLIK